MTDKRKRNYVLVVALVAGLALSFRPGLLLVHKSANTEDASYVKGWEDGCVSGSNSYSLLYAPLLDKPFVKEIAFGSAKKEADKEVSKAPANEAMKEAAPSLDKDMYKSGWNEGFTLCRYYQSSVYELMQFAIVIATLLFMGYILGRRRG